MCKGSNTTNTSSAPDPYAKSILQGVYSGAENTATANPYVPYTGELTAGQNTQQTNAAGDIAQTPGQINSTTQQIGNTANQISNAGQIAQPYYSERLQALQNGATDLQNYGLGALGTANSAIGSGVGALGSAAGAYGNAAGAYGKAAGAYGNATGAYGAEAGYTGAGAGAVDPTQFSKSAVEQYMSPYTSNVVNATQSQFNNQNAVQGNSLIGQAIASGNAF